MSFVVEIDRRFPVRQGLASPVRARNGQALLEPGVERIAIANPEHAPYGRAAVAALRSAGIYEQVQRRLVYGENIAQAAQFVASGSAQAGILALSLASSASHSISTDTTCSPPGKLRIS